MNILYLMLLLNLQLTFDVLDTLIHVHLKKNNNWKLIVENNASMKVITCRWAIKIDVV